MRNLQASIGGVVDMTEIDGDCYKLRPPGWIFFLYVLVLLLILGLLISQPASTFELKWFLVAIVSVVLVGLLKMLIKANYLVTLIADRRGLYFPSRIAESYYLIPWARVLTIEKVSFPLNRRGLRVRVDCDCFNAAVSEIGNVLKEQGRCFIYTIPQLRNRDKVIEDLENIRYSSCEANPAADV